MKDAQCRGYAGGVPIYCAHDKVVPIAEIKPNPKNPNQHPKEQIKLLAKIIKTQGWRAPVTVSTRSGLVVRGHGRLMAAKHLGLDSVPVDFQHYSCYDAELADLLADNKIAELAEIDSEMLAEVFQNIDPNAIDIDITGYSEEEYNEIVSALMEATQGPEQKDLDSEVTLPEVAVTKQGDIWLLGKHRLMCSNSADQVAVDSLLGGVKADMVFTDPPYGIGIDGQKKSVCKNPKHNRKSHEFMGWDNQRPDKHIFDYIISLNVPTVIFGGNYFADWLPASRGWIYWDKGQDGLTMSDGELAWTNLDKPLRRVLANRAQLQGSVHPTQKPISVVKFCLDYAGNGVKVLDLFGGSGSTLITCEQMERTCYTMELEPKYCDVIVRRYMQVTGKKDVTLLRDGKEIPVTETGIID